MSAAADVLADVPPAVRGAEGDTLIEDWLETDRAPWTRKVVARHFRPETGSSYRLLRAARLDLDARDITRYEQLTVFGPFPVDVLRPRDPAGLMPLDVPRPPTGLARDTGGTTCRTWLRATPTGPGLIGDDVGAMSDLYAGQVYAAGMDPRRVERLVRAGRPADATEYTTHPLERVGRRARPRPGRRRHLRSRLRQHLRRRGGHACRAEHRTHAIWPELPAGENERHTQSGLVNGGGIRHRRTGPTDRVARRPVPSDILERDRAPRYGTGSKWPSDGVANVTPLQTASPAPEGLR
ncbi:hypothetical protein ACKI16_43415 [Streptomyces scabiei]|uniref:hypothetical protein n=1 Tax=Streptomyces scabiei TaxID=1930 RepID=UPI0038F7DDD8